jgi:putative holliday junction resolvase
MQEKPKSPRILGVDYGLRRIGLAISDERKIIALPLPMMEAEKRLEMTAKKLVDKVATIEKEYRCSVMAIVLGLPLMMSGKSGLIADEVKHFVSLLEKMSPIPIKLWDERLSSAQAEKALRQTDLTRKRRSKMVDTVSAVIILQSYLDNFQMMEDRILRDKLIENIEESR